MRRGRVSRRQFLGRTGAWGAGALSLAALVQGCGRGEADGPNRLIVESWPAYIDETSDAGPGTVDRFRAATGVDLRYNETINDNQEYFAKIQPRLGTGRTIEPDLIVLTNWLAARLIRLGWVDPLPLDQVPNRANLDPSLRHPNWDPAGEYSLPYQVVVTGIAYNRKATGRDLASIRDLFDPALAGKVGLLTEMRDTIGMLLLARGVDPAAITTFAEAAPAFDQLDAIKRAGQVRAFTGNDYIDDLSTGNFAACLAWGVDVLPLMRDNPDVRFIVPDEGGMLAPDAWLMPRGAGHRDAAARWLNFLYDPAQAAHVSAAIATISPVVGVRAELETIDPELAASPLLFPDEATRARLRIFANVDEDVELQFDEAFSRITGA